MTKVELANLALGFVGVRPGLSEWEERGTNGQAVRDAWPLARQELLRGKAWNFATKRAVLSAAADAPAFDWDYAYALPADCLKVLEFNAKLAGTGEATFDLEGKFILSDDDTAQLRYTADVEDCSQWDASFCQAFAHGLAALIAPSLSTNPQLGMQLRNAAENIALQAAGPNNVEGRPRAVLAQTGSSWMNARRGVNS